MSTSDYPTADPPASGAGAPENPPLKHALAYAGPGLAWHPFPLAPRSKAPAGSLVPKGHRDASRDPGLIRHWFEGHPELNVGLAMAPSGLTLLDVDTRHGGDETLADLERAHGELPETVEAVTGGGGAHYLFKRPANLEPHDYIGLWPGIDVKALGYAVVAPSIHPETGQAYRWALGKEPGRIDVAPLPAWIAEAMAAHRNGHKAAAPVPDRIPEGGRNAALASIGGSMRRRGASVAAIEAALLAENAERCEPPLPEPEVKAIAASVGRYSPPPQQKEESAATRALIVHSAEQERDAVDAAPTRWRVEGLLADGAITENAAKVKLGKTTLTLQMVAAVVSGTPFLDLATAPAKVLFLTEERPATFRAALKRANIGAGVEVVYRYETFGMTWPEVMAQVVTHCLIHGVSVLVIDTLSSWAGFTDDNENSAGAGMEAIRPLEQAAAGGLAIWYNRHDRKGGGEIGESGRGTSALAGAADILLQLKRADTEGHPNRRILAGIGRFDGVPDQVVIELTDDGYRSLGNAIAVEQAKVEAWLTDHLPGPETPATVEELRDGLGKIASKSTLDRVLDRMVDSGRVGKAARGFGKSKRAAGYWTPPADNFSGVRGGEKLIFSGDGSPSNFSGGGTYVPTPPVKSWAGRSDPPADDIEVVNALFDAEATE